MITKLDLLVDLVCIGPFCKLSSKSFIVSLGRHQFRYLYVSNRLSFSNRFPIFVIFDFLKNDEACDLYFRPCRALIAFF